MTKKEAPQSFTQRIKALSRNQKRMLWATGIVVLYTLVGFFVLPPIVKLLLEKKLPEILHRQVTIDKIRLNPYALTTTIEGFALQRKDTKGSLLAFERVFVDLQTVSLFKMALITKSVDLTGPKINFSRNQDQTFSFADLLSKKTEKSPPSEETRPFFFSINNITITKGTIDFHDIFKDKKNRITEITLSVPSISNLNYEIENHVQPAFSANINNSKFSLGGKTKPFANSRETSIDVKINDINIPEYLRYIPIESKLTLKSATLDIDARLLYLEQLDNTSKLSITGLFSLRDIDIVDQQARSYVRLPDVKIIMADSNLLEKEINVANITIKEPDMELERLTDRNILPLSLLTNSAALGQNPQEKINSEKSDSSVRLSVAEILIQQGSLQYKDTMVEPFITTLSPIDVKVVNFSTIEKKQAEMDITVKTEVNESLTLKGNFSISPLALDGDAAIDGIMLTKYVPYLQDILIPDLTSGKVDMQTTFHYSKKDTVAKTSLSNLAVTLTDFILEDTANQKIIRVPQLGVLDTEFQLEEKTVIIGAIQSQKADISIVKNKNGTINLEEIIRSPEKSQKHVSDTRPENDSSKKSVQAWSVQLKKAKFDQYSATFEDHVPAEPAITKIDNFAFGLTDISNKKNNTGNLEFKLKLNETGEISGRGKISIIPLSSSLALDIKNIDIQKFSPYITEQFNIVLKDGAVAAQGDFDLQQTDEEGIVFQFSGNSQASNLAIRDSLLREELLSWKSLNFNNLHYSYKPQSIGIEEISLKNLYTKLIIAEDGTLNLATLKRPPDANDSQPETPATKEEKQTTQIEINNIMIKGGKIDFMDQKIKPAYSASLEEVNGSITGLSSLEQALAKVKITAKLNQHALLDISGKMNPLKEKLYADLNIDFNDIDLSPTSPYTGKFIGYKTDKGKLTLNLHYVVDDSEIEAKNQIFLDQFTLGETVDSPDAVNLPINLAIALLKNRNGEISLDIPVQGNIDDPEFSIGGVIFKILFNLIAKAATSPFALLGALIPDGEDLQYVAFRPGLAELTEDARSNLLKMAEVLYERPSLRMDIIGKVDPRKDREALTQMRFDQFLKVQKMQDRDIKENAPPESIEINDEEYPHYLAKAFQVLKLKEIEEGEEIGFFETIKKKRLLKKQVKLVQSETNESNNERQSLIGMMKQKLREQIRVSDGDLRLLAIERMNQTIDFLVENGPVESERLFVIEPQIPSGDSTDGGQAVMQVEMVIR
ncbi:MAG: DUF748 domain-containing protein [Desulfobulbaceae bacterium]|nr:DUF748 domain-containing protein [Desulfobulbaceae bacterium]